MSSVSQPSCIKPRSNTSCSVVVSLSSRTSKKQHHRCIFCGKTVRVSTFKGRSVCMNCLQLIPSVFRAVNN